MKKVLGIMVLGLLLSGSAYANTFYLNCDRKIYENNGSGDWSLYYKVGNSPDGSILIKTEDWNFEDRLSKEFESVGFFISDHPLNQFKEIFDDYKNEENYEALARSRCCKYSLLQILIQVLV